MALSVWYIGLVAFYDELGSQRSDVLMVNPINQTLYNFVERRILKKAPIAKLFV